MERKAFAQCAILQGDLPLVSIEVRQELNLLNDSLLTLFPFAPSPLSSSLPPSSFVPIVPLSFLSFSKRKFKMSN